MKFLDGGGEGLDIGFGFGTGAALLDAAHGGEGESGEDGDDGDDDEEFDEGEGGEAAVAGGEWLVAGIGGALRARRRSEIGDRRSGGGWALRAGRSEIGDRRPEMGGSKIVPISATGTTVVDGPR